MTKCPICNRQVKQIYKKIPVFECKYCNLQLAKPQVNRETYNKKYQSKEYELYKRLAKNVKKSKMPLKYLEKQNPSYKLASKLVDIYKPSSVLEVGCGVGYLTYIIKMKVKNTFGVDISRKAIKIAKANFGSNYKVADIIKLKTKKKYDLIIAADLIEHLENPKLLVKKMRGLLNEKGIIFVTTPNKSFYPKCSLWKTTDKPPVHLTWLSEKSIFEIAKKTKLKLMILRNITCYGVRENKIKNYIISRLGFLNNSIDVAYKVETKKTKRKKQSKLDKIFVALGNRLYDKIIKTDYNIYAIFMK